LKVGIIDLPTSDPSGVGRRSLHQLLFIAGDNFVQLPCLENTLDYPLLIDIFDKIEKFDVFPLGLVQIFFDGIARGHFGNVLLVKLVV